MRNMQSYDPDQAPDPAQWRAIDEGVRMGLVKLYHQAARIRLPKPNLHYAVHVVVENQIAEGMPSVLRAMARLQEQGLSRHDALHAIASVAARRVADQLKADDPHMAATFEERYSAELDRLSAADWRRMTAEAAEPPQTGS
jgi:hypothetical protein